MFGNRIELPGSVEIDGAHRMVIDWHDLREVVGSFLFNESHPQIRNSGNVAKFRDHSSGIGTGTSKARWHGYSTTELKTWVTKGFQTDILHGLSVSPVREKQRYIYAEDAEEIHVDRALSGEDNFMGGWTKRTIIPGVAIEADVMFASTVDAQIVIDYNVFLCQCIQSLEMSGIDCEVTLNFTSGSSIGGSYKNGHNVVRVKRENEQSDFSTYSPMFSPAALRTFGFGAILIHNEILGRTAPMGLGHGHGGREWSVKYDEKAGKIRVNCPYSPSSYDRFPKSEMLAQFQNTIREITG